MNFVCLFSKSSGTGFVHLPLKGKPEAKPQLHPATEVRLHVLGCQGNLKSL
jgi:hypothetical protein